MGEKKYSESLYKTLLKLDKIYGVSGDEDRVAAAMREEMEGLYDQHMEDPLGNQFFIKKGKNPNKRVLFSAHMDEIGYMINHIEDNGFAKFVPVGYHDDRTAFNQIMVVHTRDGRQVEAVTGAKPFHIMTEEEMSKVVKIEDLFLDFGTTSAEETRALGVEIGDYLTYKKDSFLLNGTSRFTGRALDNRASCAVLVEVMRRLKDKDIEPEVCMVGSTMEEVGMRAGAPITNRYKPELVMAVDVTITGDIPGIEMSQISQKMGAGPSVKFYDWDGMLGATGNNVPRRLTNRIIEVAEKNDIPYQREVITGGGTDAWSASMAGCGVLAGGICIPQRYMHSGVGMLDLADMEQAVELIVSFLLDYKTL